MIMPFSCAASRASAIASRLPLPPRLGSHREKYADSAFHRRRAPARGTATLQIEPDRKSLRYADAPEDEGTASARESTAPEVPESRRHVRPNGEESRLPLLRMDHAHKRAREMRLSLQVAA